jgi:outer membrane protein assembly factor BamB
VIDAQGFTLDTLLYEKKLNGGISAQVVGNSDFLVVPTFNRRIYFLDPNTGKEITSYSTESSVESAAAIDDELVYFVEQSGSDLLTCLNLINGKVVFTHKLSDPQTAPIVAGDDLFVTERSGNIYNLNRFRGDTTWVYNLESQVYGEPAADSEIVVIGTADGVVHCLERASGEVHWQVATSGTIFGQPLIADYIYCGSADGKMYAFNKSSGEVVWFFETSAPVHTTPVLIDGQLIFGSDDQTIYALNSADGETLWTLETNGIIQGSPVVAGSTVIVPNSAGSIYVISLDGNLQKHFRVDGSIKSSPAIINGRLYVTTTSRRLFCFSAHAAPKL